MWVVDLDLWQALPWLILDEVAVPTIYSVVLFSAKKYNIEADPDSFGELIKRTPSYAAGVSVFV